MGSSNCLRAGDHPPMSSAIGMCLWWLMRIEYPAIRIDAKKRFDTDEMDHQGAVMFQMSDRSHVLNPGSVIDAGPELAHRTFEDRHCWEPPPKVIQLIVEAIFGKDFAPD